jgi:hypothetical protein
MEINLKILLLTLIKLFCIPNILEEINNNEHRLNNQFNIYI